MLGIVKYILKMFVDPLEYLWGTEFEKCYAIGLKALQGQRYLLRG